MGGVRDSAKPTTVSVQADFFLRRSWESAQAVHATTCPN
jgi:hypothetical protein